MNIEEAIEILERMKDWLLNNSIYSSSNEHTCLLEEDDWSFNFQTLPPEKLIQAINLIKDIHQ